MNFNSILIQPIVALLAGILILVQPALLNIIVALYLIIVGVVGLAPHFLR
jgi:threonine/homoserine efflux transporter RhtA